MKKIVVFYSLDGNTRFAAGVIAQEIGADILELKPEKDIPRKGFIKYLWGGRQVFMKEAPALLPFEKNPEDYDMLAIGTPVWAWRYAPAVESFLKKAHLKNKRIALFCCHGGSRGKTFEKMKERLSGNEIVGMIDLMEPLRMGREKAKEKLVKWAHTI